MGFEMIGLLLALAIQGPFVSSGVPCIKPNMTITNETNITMNELLARGVIEPEPSLWEKNIYVFFAMILTAIFLVGNYLLVYFVRERKGN